MSNEVKGARGGAFAAITAAFATVAAALVATVPAAPAWGAVVTVLDNPTIDGTPISLLTANFTRLGQCGTGESVIGDGCSVVDKNNPDAPDAFGRFSPFKLDWIDSQDIDDLVWTVTSDVPFQSMTFALVDAHDQPNSYFNMIYDGTEIWEIPTQLPNRNLFWLMVTFDGPVTTADLRFTTRHNDGYGILAARVAPVPLPPAALLLLTGTALIAGLRRRRRDAGTA
jgi:hypothetical protein